MRAAIYPSKLRINKMRIDIRSRVLESYKKPHPTLCGNILIANEKVIDDDVGSPLCLGLKVNSVTVKRNSYLFYAALNFRRHESPTPS